MIMNDVYRGFSGKKILVVGGAGFVGSNLVRAMLNHGDPAGVTVVDNLLSAERFNVPEDPRVTFIQGSITDQAVLDQLPDEYHFMFHLATFHGNQSSIHDPLRDHENNTFTTLRLMEHCRDFKVLEKLVYSSAGCSVAQKTFDKAEATTEQELVAIAHDSPYSISKIIGEFYSVYYHRQHGLPTVRARFQNVYGPGEVLGAGQWRGTPATVWRNVLPTFVYKALKGMSLPLENEGIATRDFIFVEDVARGLASCALRGEPGEVYNIATGVETSIRNAAEQIIQLTGNTAGVELLPRRSWDHSGKRFGSPEKSRDVLQFEAQVNFPDGLVRMVEWTRTNLELIESCMDKHRDKLN